VAVTDPLRFLKRDGEIQAGLHMKRTASRLRKRGERLPLREGQARS